MQPWIEVAPGIRVTGNGAAWLPDVATIVVADVHVGYELAARRRGGYLPIVARGAELGERLVEMATALDASRIVIAGDLRHSTRDVDTAERDELLALATAQGIPLYAGNGHGWQGWARAMQGAGAAGLAELAGGALTVVVAGETFSFVISVSLALPPMPAARFDSTLSAASWRKS